MPSVSPEDLLKYSEVELQQFALASTAEDLEELFKAIWVKVSPLYAGPPKSLESAHALELARVALTISTHAKNRTLQVDALHFVGRCLGANEEFEQAIPLYQQAIAGYEELGNWHQAARIRLGLMGVLLNAARYDEAFDVAGTAENLFKRNQDELGLARLYNNIANIYFRKDDHARAYEYNAKAYDLFQQLGDPQSIAFSSLNLANALADIDQFERAEQMYEQAINVARQIGLTDVWTQAEYNRSYFYYLRGRYSTALEGFARLRQKFEEAGSWRHYALCDLDEAEIYLQLNLSKDAAALAIRAADRCEKLGLRYEQAKATAFHGVALIQMRRYSEALQVFRDAQQIYAEENNVYWMGLIDLYRAEVHISLQRYWEAQALATQAKATFDQLEIPSKRILSLVLLGRVALALNDLAAADRASLEIAGIVKDLKIPLVLFPYHLLAAEVAERTRRVPLARKHYEAAAEELEQHQARLHHDDLRVTFFKGRQRAYDALVRISLEDPEEKAALATAYAWCERARSRGLIELLSHYAPAGHGDVDQSLLSKITRLREELNTYYTRWQPESNPAPPEDFDTIAMKEQELARTLRDVSTASPEYGSLQQVSIADLQAVQSVLPARTTIIEYFTSGDEIIVFIITATGGKVMRRLCPAQRVLSMQERLGFQLEKFLLGGSYVNTHSEQMLVSTNRHLQELYRNLIAPFAADLKTQHLVIIPHGSLHFLPFHAFFDGERYLIDKFEVTYAPSASVLKYCLEKEPIHVDVPVLIGVADENAPLVTAEVTNLGRLFPNARILLNEDATREAFSEQSKISSFLHIATHAVFRQDNPMFSSFKLADGWFTAFDLFSMTCQTNLVTLSGCQSGMSEVTGADDLLGLMRGFLYAGARSLLLSLWNVSDESTTELMAKFYRDWSQGSEKSIAFRSAMLALRDVYPNPFYWAPFLLIGNP